METRNGAVLTIAIASIALVFALPFLQFMVFIWLVFVIINLIVAATQDGDLLLMYYEKWGADGSKLRGKVAWITGASSGIGKALAYDLAQHGVKLILSARREKELKEVKDMCLQYSCLHDDDILVLPLDFSKFDSHQRCVKEALKHFSKVDILVNNAGRSMRSFYVETKLEVDKAIKDINFLGQVSLTKSILPHMIGRGEGHIVLISFHFICSVVGTVPLELSATYSATKHALHGYFGSLACECDAVNITSVCPGPVDESNIVENAFDDNLNQPKFKSTSGSECEPGVMTAERCATLITVAIANRLSEVWIAQHLPLLLLHMYHWAPLLTTRFKKIVYGGKRIQEFEQAQGTN